MDLEISDEEYFDTFSDFHDNETDTASLCDREIKIINNSNVAENNTCSDFCNELINNMDSSSKNENISIESINNSDEIFNLTDLERENCHLESNINEQISISCNENLDSSNSSGCEAAGDELDRHDLTENNEMTNESTDNVKSNEEIQLEERIKLEATLSIEEITELKERSLSTKEQGNASYKLEQYQEAVEFYTNAISICPLQFNEEHAIFHSNRGTALGKLQKSDEAINDFSIAIKLKPQYLKALLRRAELREKAEKFSEALEDYREVLKIDNRNWPALYAEQTLPEKIRVQQEKMKEEMFTQLKQLGNLVLKPFGLSTDNFKMVQDPSTGSYSINFQNK